LGEARPALLSPHERRLALAKDGAVGAVAVTGIASAAAGIRFAGTAPDGAVPMKTGDRPAKRTPPAGREAQARGHHARLTAPRVGGGARRRQRRSLAGELPAPARTAPAAPPLLARRSRAAGPRPEASAAQLSMLDMSA